MILGQDELPDLFWTGCNPLDPTPVKWVAFADNRPLRALPLVTDQPLPCEIEA